MTTISLTYALNKDHRDSLLFYLPARRRHGNDKDVDFLALEMVDRKIRFVWNVGGGTQVLTHPLDLLPISDDLNDDSRWYHILVQRYPDFVRSIRLISAKLTAFGCCRTGHVASLDVRPVKDDGGGGGASGSTKVTGTGASRFTKLDLTTGDRIYIGVLPPNPSTDVKVCLSPLFNSIKSKLNSFEILSKNFQKLFKEYLKNHPNTLENRLKTKRKTNQVIIVLLICC